MKKDILNLQVEFREARIPFVLATVVEILGSSSAKPGAKAIFDRSGKVIEGWIGGGCAQSIVAKESINCLTDGEPRMVDIDLNDEVFGAGMPCGGSMRVYVEPKLPRPLLWLMGNGLIAETLCELAHLMGFHIVVIDTKATSREFPAAHRIIENDGSYLELKPNSGDFVVIATHHKGDFVSLTRALQSKASYIALVSSRSRADLIMNRLEQEGTPKNSLNRIHAPAGLNLGAKMPEEIALSIISEMVLTRRGGQGTPLSI
ncbi:MAG: XdhC family protein [Steroidobacteraceae bacterium]